MAVVVYEDENGRTQTRSIAAEFVERLSKAKTVSIGGKSYKCLGVHDDNVQILVNEPPETTAPAAPATDPFKSWNEFAERARDADWYKKSQARLAKQKRK